MNSLATRVEALLFVAGEAVLKTELARILNVEMPEVESAIGQLHNALEGHGISIVATNDEVEIVTSTSVADFIGDFLAPEEGLSKSAAETLSIVAYRGPISRVDIDLIRGVDSRRMVRQLLQSGLILKVKTEGRAPLYDISTIFLQQAGVNDRTELPQYSELSTHEKVQELLKKTEDV